MEAEGQHNLFLEQNLHKNQMQVASPQLLQKYKPNGTLLEDETLQKPYKQLLSQKQQQKQMTSDKDCISTKLLININLSNKQMIYLAQKGKLLQSPIAIFKDTQWKSSIARFQNQQLNLNGKKILISDITKIKIMKHKNLSTLGIIKLSLQQNQNMIFGVQSQQKFLNVPLKFAWFSFLITAKMRSQNVHLHSTQIIQSQLKIRRYLTNALIFGTIYKKSQYLGTWSSRFVVITPDALFSYRSVYYPYTFCIRGQKIKYIWTRFQQINGHIIIKIKYGLSKTQFAIPISYYCNISCYNWLYSFYILMNRQILMEF